MSNDPLSVDRLYAEISSQIRFTDDISFKLMRIGQDQVTIDNASRQVNESDADSILMLYRCIDCDDYAS